MLWGSMDLWNVGILPQNYTMSQPEDGGSMDLWNVGILPQNYTMSQPEDGGSMDLWNVGILPQHNTMSQPEDGGSMDLWNVGILPQHYTTSQLTWKSQHWITQPNFITVPVKAETDVRITRYTVSYINNGNFTITWWKAQSNVCWRGIL
jgi:hypothetical protein